MDVDVDVVVVVCGERGERGWGWRVRGVLCVVWEGEGEGEGEEWGGEWRGRGERREGEGLGVSWSVADVVRKTMEMTALVADRAAKFLCSARELFSVGSRSDMRPTESVLHHKRDGRVLLQRCGKRDSLDFSSGKEDTRNQRQHDFHHKERGRVSPEWATCTAHGVTCQPRMGRDAMNTPRATSSRSQRSRSMQQMRSLRRSARHLKASAQCVPSVLAHLMTQASTSKRRMSQARY